MLELATWVNGLSYYCSHIASAAVLDPPLRNNAGESVMKHIFYVSAGVALLGGVFFWGYWMGGGTHSQAEKETAVPISTMTAKKTTRTAKKTTRREHVSIPSEQKTAFSSGHLAGSKTADSESKSHMEDLVESVRASGVPEEDVEMVAETLADLNETAPQTVSRTAESEPAPQTMEELVVSVRASGVPEEDVEAVADTLAGLTGIGTELTDQDELTASQQMEVADSVRASGVPEEDVEMVAETLGAVALSEDFFNEDEVTSYEERIIEAVDSAIEAGVPEEDVEAVAETIAGPEQGDTVPDQAEQAEKIAEIADAVREAGVPEEDVEAVAETLAGAYPEFSTEEVDSED